MEYDTCIGSETKTKEYKENNEEKIKKCKEEWYQKNKEKISQKLKETFTCECGSEHYRSNKHKSFMEQTK
jgi:hypothetical protein